MQSSEIIDHTNSLLENLEEDKESDNGSEKDHAEQQSNIDYQKARTLLKFEDAPEYLKHNPFILTGYRGMLNTDLCIQRYGYIYI